MGSFNYICRNCGIDEDDYCIAPSHHLCKPGLNHVFGQVPVIEAVLTDELVEKVARALGQHAADKFGADHVSSITAPVWKGYARAALRIAGFQGPGGDDGH